MIVLKNAMGKTPLSAMTLGKLIREQPDFVERRIRFLLDERRDLQRHLKNARIALTYVAKTCVENPVVATYAKNAAANLPAPEAPSVEDAEER